MIYNTNLTKYQFFLALALSNHPLVQEISILPANSDGREIIDMQRLVDAQVLAGVKMELVQPYPDSPDEGTFMTTAELHPMASNEFDIGKPGIEAIEVGRIIDRGIRESGIIDWEKLCIKEGEKVWQKIPIPMRVKRIFRHRRERK
jgi:exosome complex component RRP42